jgi:hypothetical protein
MQQQIYPKGKIPQYRFLRRLGKPKRQSGHGREQKNLLPPGNQTPATQSIAYNDTDRAILAHSLLSFSLLIPEKNIHSPYSIFSFAIFPQQSQMKESTSDA